MNRRHRYIQLCLCLCVLVAVPSLCTAQLSSTNYQVDVYGVGDENAGTATSSQYQIDGAIGSSFERNSSVSNSAGETDTTSGSVRTARDVSNETNPSNPDTTNQESSTQTAPGPARDQGLDIDPGTEGVSGSSEVSGKSSGHSPESTQIDEGAAHETAQAARGRCIGLFECYWWVVVGGPIALGIFYVYSRRKMVTG